jgi:hypothetical protein
MDRVLLIDIAYPRLSANEAEAELDSALKKVVLSKTLRAIRIIHGVSGDGEQTSRAIVDNWIFLNRSRLKCAIHSNGIDTFGQSIEELAAHCDFSIRDEFGVATEWSTVVWVK